MFLSSEWFRILLVWATTSSNGWNSDRIVNQILDQMRKSWEVYYQARPLLRCFPTTTAKILRSRLDIYKRSDYWVATLVLTPVALIPGELCDRFLGFDYCHYFDYPLVDLILAAEDARGNDRLDLILPFSEHPSGWIRGAFCYTAECILDRRSLPILLYLFENDPDTHVRRNAMRAIARFGVKSGGAAEVQKELVKIVLNPNPSMTKHFTPVELDRLLFDCFSNLGSSSIPSIAHFLRTPGIKHEHLVMAIERAKWIGYLSYEHQKKVAAALLDDLIRFVDSDESDLFNESLDAICAISGSASRAMPKLLENLGRRSGHQKSRLINLITIVDNSSEKVIGAVVDAMMNMEDGDLAFALHDVYRNRVRSAKLVQFVSKFKFHKSSDLRIEMVLVLGENLADPEALKILELLKKDDPDSEVRRIAAKVLAKYDVEKKK